MNCGLRTSLAIFACPYFVSAATLLVGPTRQYTTPAAASGAAHDGDTVLIDAGSYVNCTTWTKNNLLIRGVGGYAHVRDQACGGKAIWNIDGSNTTIENVEFSGATVADKNGAGIRMEGTDLTVRHCWFHDNEDGILAGDNANSTITIEFSTFEDNGFGDGYSHNMYINHVKEFTLRGCLVRRARVGHNVKSRAYSTHILYNKIIEETTGTTSRSIDIPNGGEAVIEGNVIEQGPQGQNNNMVEFGLEGETNPGHRYVLINNTLVNDRPQGSPSFVDYATGPDTLVLVNNIFAGNGAVIHNPHGEIDSSNNLVVQDTAAAGLMDPSTYDYHLIQTSPAIDAGSSLSLGSGVSLPDEEYVDSDSTAPRHIVNVIDIGAYEYPVSLGVRGATAVVDAPTFTVSPNPVSSGVLTVRVGGNAAMQIFLFDRLGERVAAGSGSGAVRIDCAHLPSGMYFLRSSQRGVNQGTEVAIVR